MSHSISQNGTNILEIAKDHQIGRVPENGTNVPFNTQEQIGKRIGWSENKVKQYSAVLNNVVTQVLDLAREYQEGRVTDKVTNVTFNFTEWCKHFRNC